MLKMQIAPKPAKKAAEQKPSRSYFISTEKGEKEELFLCLLFGDKFQRTNARGEAQEIGKALAIAALAFSMLEPQEQEKHLAEIPQEYIEAIGNYLAN